MRMKFNRLTQLVLVSAVSLLAAGLVTACGTLTVDYIFVTSAKAAGPNNYGEIDVFEVNSESGHLKPIPTSPFPSGGRNPVAEAVSTDFTTLYVANEDDNTIVQFLVGSDGKLYPQNTVNTPGVFPLAVAAAGKNLFVADLYQPLPTCSNAAPCSGSIASFPVNSDDSLGAPAANLSLGANYWPLILPSNPTHVLMPTAIATVASGADIYVTASDTASGLGYVFGYAVNSDGTLTSLTGSPFAAGSHPSAVAGDPSGTYLYVTDFTKSDILAYKINAGILTPLGSGPFPSGSGPSGIVVDSAGKFAYVSNSQDSNVIAYTISNGTLTSAGTYATGIQPVALIIDPSLNQYLYTANFLGDTVTGFQLNANDGTLLNTLNSPYKANDQPTALAAIPHGVKQK
jgi:6-phosphogluconolactonase (cycloisomerase 2 family)